MGIKDLFGEKTTGIIVSTSLEEEVVRNTPELESTENIKEQRKKLERFIPLVDFSDPNNFVNYGSAEAYYKDAISRVYNQYPYDGTAREKQEFLNNSTYVDLYLFENSYPRTTGYGVFSPDGWGTSTVTATWGLPSSLEYISAKGGPHTSSGGIPAGSLNKAFGDPTYRTSPNANIYQEDLYATAGIDPLDRVGSRESNLKFDLSNGVSTEFWIRKGEWITALTEKEVVFDLWNGTASGSADSSYDPKSGYGRLLIYLTGSGDEDGDENDAFRVHLASGSSVWDMSFGGTTVTTSSLKNTWKHCAFTFLSSSADAQLQSKFYVDGKLLESKTTTNKPFGEVAGPLIAHLGALQTTPSGNAFFGVSMVGAGKLSGSLDELRYWKSKRTDRDIYRNWWTQVNGGTNTEEANTELGLYYKFNEGITGTSSVDSVVLDYSGRISNGAWTGYGSNSRNTGSAIISASAAASEYEDPIIYSHHSEVLSLYNDLVASGSLYDRENASSIKDSLPSWISDDEEYNGSGHLDNITQIIGSYFDTINLQIQGLTDFKEATYQTSSYMKTTPFSDRLLSSNGLYAPEIFVEADILERFASRNEEEEYTSDISEIKNQIYQNIYNNLIFIYKSKGTEKAFRNLIHCYGLGDEVIKFNAYGNNTTFKLDDTHYNTTIRKNYADFNHPNRFEGTVYQNSSSTSVEDNSVTFISGTNASFAYTSEVEVIFPKKHTPLSPLHFNTTFITSSIFGNKVANSDPTNFTNAASNADYSFALRSIRTHEDSKDVYFELSASNGSFLLTSSIYGNVYDNQKWNFGIRVKDAKWPYATGITGSSVEDDVKVELVGYNTEYGVVKNSFSLTASSLVDEFLTSRLRYYAGAERTAYAGAILARSDVKVSSVRHWATYLEDAVIRAHSLDPENFGTLHPARNAIFAADSVDFNVDNVELLESETLALHWDFSEVTGTDSSGRFVVEDISSGSVDLQSRYPSDGNLSEIIANVYSGTGYFPGSVSSAQVVDKEYVASSKQRLPEVVNGDDAVNVLTQDDDLFPTDPAISQTFYAFEKSMYGVISQEMVNIFGTIVEFNNLIGEVTSKYRNGYKDLDRLRTLFFDKIQNNPDLDKFIDYYKWIDNSLSTMIQQLVPASANVADEIRTVVESHIFERSSYRHQYPMLEYKGNSRWGGDEAVLEGRARSGAELAYDWKHGHAPITGVQNTNALWWQKRAGRDNATFDTATSIGTARRSINDIMLSFNSASYDARQFAGADTTYAGSTYALRQLSSTVRMKMEASTEIRSGYNFPRTQKPESIASIIKPGSTTELQVTTTSFPDIDVEEVGAPILSVRRPFGTETSENTKNQSPIGQFSSSLGTTEFAGLHTDAYGDNYETPMQGPFSQEHIGGYQHRHTALNTGADTLLNRQEAWEITAGDTFTTRSSMDHPPAYPAYQRDVKAKRPVNIRNIQSATGSSILGNYQNIYEIVQTSGRNTNNSVFVKSEGFGSSSTISNHFPDLIDYTKPTRRKTKHVIVERFSAPGGPETAGDAAGGPFLDLESGQYSPYNNINYRNETVRRPLRTLLTERNEQFGLRSGSSNSETDYYALATTGSIHKINKNRLQRLSYADQYTGHQGSVITSSAYDNYYVQHMIPRSDRQYSWITASLFVNDDHTLGIFPSDGLKAVGKKAQAILTVGDGDGYFPSGTHLQKLTMTATDGTSFTFTLVNLNSTDVAQGDVLAEGDQVSSGVTLASDSAAIGTIAFLVSLSGTRTTRNGMFNILSDLINRADIFLEKIVTDGKVTDVNGTQSRTLTQLVDGYAGNTIVTTDIDGLTVTNFEGGEDISLQSSATFCSSSDIGTGLVSGIRRTVNNPGTFDAGSFIPTDFVGLNTTIIEPITASSLTLGYPTDLDVAHYYNYSDIGSFATNTENQESFVEQIGGNTAARTVRAYTLNNVLSHRQGPYGHPTWKQIRVGEGQLGRYLRKNNLYTHTPAGGEETTMFIGDNTFSIYQRYGASLQVSQSVVTSRCKPITHQLLVRTGIRRSLEVENDYIKAIDVRSTYANNIAYFDINEFTKKVGINVEKGFNSYDQIKKMYLNGALESTTSPVMGVRRIFYSEVVYPSMGNSYTNKVRGRTSYQNNFWKDDRTNRTTLASTKKPNSSMGIAYAQSAWALDADEDFITNNVTGGVAGQPALGHRAGELQNRYVQFHSGTLMGGGSAFLGQGPLYSRYHIMPTTASIVPNWGMVPNNADLVGGATGYESFLPVESLFRGQARWEAGTKAGRYEGEDNIFSVDERKPFDDDYDTWFSELKAKGQGMSIIPEFKISDHMDFYKNNDYNFLADNTTALQIAGVPSGTAGFPQNESEADFVKIFSTSDFLRHFDIIRDEHKDFLEPWAIKIKCKVLKKFIAYDGFYPAERTLQMATQFSSSYADSVSYDGIDRANAGAFRSFIKPMFAPGILYNTIKAGMAVDYPIMTGSYKVAPAVHYNDFPADLHDIKHKSHSASFGIVSNSSLTSSASRYHWDGWDKRIPFEALVEPERYLANINIVDDEPSPLCNQDVTASWGGTGNDQYKYMMHNFLAESLNFFIRNGKPTSLKSLPAEQWKSVTPGQPYGMRIKIRRSMDGVKTQSGSWGPFAVPQNVKVYGSVGPQFGGGGIFGLLGNRGVSFGGSATQDQTIKENFTMYSRPSSFGPPVLAITASLGHGKEGWHDQFPASGSGFEFGSENGIYSSHTPPYYDGESWIDIIFYPQGLQAVSGSGDTSTPGDADVPHLFANMVGDGAIESYVPTVEEISSPVSDEVLHGGADAVPVAGSFVRYWRFDQEELQRESNTIGSYNKGDTGISQGYGPQAGPWVNRWAMQGDASLNIFEKDADARWVIQSKFETPMLNFNHITSSDGTLTKRAETNSNATIPKGMWHQFGRLPQEEQGVFLEVSDIPPEWLANHPNASLVPDIAGTISGDNRSERIPKTITDGAAAAKTYYNSYTLPIDAGNGSFTTPSMGSLIDVCGFSSDSKRIGKIRDKKAIREAIVAIPFIISAGERSFFSLKTVSTDESVSPSVAEQIRKMQIYMLPPQLDFLRNDVPRIAMYIFGFKHKFDKDDLSHIWQNLTPKIGVRAESSYSTISHELFTNELMGDWKSVDDLPAGTIERSGFQSEVKWMVFKVKQRAKTDYFAQIGGGGGTTTSKIAQIPQYSYNWPYDFCSIIEMASIEPEIEFGVDEVKLREAVQSKLAVEAASWLGGTLISNAASTATAKAMSDISSNVDGTVYTDDDPRDVGKEGIATYVPDTTGEEQFAKDFGETMVPELASTQNAYGGDTSNVGGKDDQGTEFEASDE